MLMSGSFAINLLILYHRTPPHNTLNVVTRAGPPITAPARRRRPRLRSWVQRYATTGADRESPTDQR